MSLLCKAFRKVLRKELHEVNHVILQVLPGYDRFKTRIILSILFTHNQWFPIVGNVDLNQIRGTPLPFNCGIQHNGIEYHVAFMNSVGASFFYWRQVWVQQEGISS